MKYRYILKRDDGNKQLTISELVLRQDGTMDQIQVKNIPADEIQQALVDGESAMIAALRSDNIFPPQPVATMMAQAAAKLYDANGEDLAEEVVNEIDVQKPEPEEEEEENDEEGLDDEADDDLVDDEDENQEAASVDGKADVDENGNAAPINGEIKTFEPEEESDDEPEQN